MPRRLDYPTRSIEQIFELAGKIGAKNVMLNDAEIGIVITGGNEPVSPATIANRRYRGDLPAPEARGTDNFPLTSLHTILALSNRRKSA